MKRWIKLTLIVGLSLLFVVLTTTALQGGSSPAFMLSPETPENPTSPEQFDSAPPGVATYEGVGEPMYTCYFPSANHDPLGWSTKLFFQNVADSSTANVTVTLYYSETGTLAFSETYTLLPHARVASVVSDVTEGASFAGAAVVEVGYGGPPLACSAEVFKPDDYSSDLMAYRAPPEEYEFVAPQVCKGSAGWNSRIVIYNLDDYVEGPNDVYIDFYDHDGTWVGGVSKSLWADETWTYDTETSDIPPSGFDGWADIRAGEYGDGLPIAVVVLNENESDGGAAAFTAWESPGYELAAGLEDSSSYGPGAGLPWVTRDPSSQVNFYNLDGGATVQADYFAAGDGTLDYYDDFFLAEGAKSTRNLGSLPLPASDWSGAVLASFVVDEEYLGSGGMTALTDWGAAASGYSSFSDEDFWDEFGLPNIYRHPHKSTAFTILCLYGGGGGYDGEGSPVNGFSLPSYPCHVEVTFYRADGTTEAWYGQSIEQYASRRFDQEKMQTDLGPDWEGSVYIEAVGGLYSSPLIAVVVEEKVLGPPPQQDGCEPNDNPGDACFLTLNGGSGGAHPLALQAEATLSELLISHQYDPDWYVFTTTQPSFITVTLTDMSQDYNVVLFEDLSLTPTLPVSNMACSLFDGASVNKQSEIESTQWMASQWMASQWMASQWMASQWMASQWMASQWMASQWMASQWMASQWMASQWMASSTQPGTQDEIISTIGFHKGNYYVLVYSANGEYSDQDTYSLGVETEPLDAVVGTCEWTPTCADSPQPADVYTGTSVVGAPWTLILYNKNMLDRTYCVAEGNRISNTLKKLADLDSVRGVVVPVEDNSVYNSDVISDAYAAWITYPNYCDVTYAISVANAIRDHVISPTLAAHPTISYVVIVGGDDQIPFYRLPDEDLIANERGYGGSAMEANTKMQAVRAALLQRYYLTDNFYGTLPGAELVCGGREKEDPIFLPDLAVGRLVEGPDAIVGLINGYITSNTLTATTALATGYHFFDDCGEVISDTFVGQDLDTSSLISETWTAEDLEREWLTDKPDLASVNAHFNHWGALPATTTHGYVECTDEVSATDTLSGMLGFSIGCHSGLPVPDADVKDTADVTESLDYPQVLLQKGSHWVGNTGFGYGSDDSLAGSERLMWYYAQELGYEDQVAAGEALVWAKRRYLGGASSGGFGAIDRKVMHESTYYGLPMYLVDVPTNTKFPPPVPHTTSAPQALGFPWGLNVVTITVQPTLDPPHITPDGTFYSIGGETQNRPGRPIQPFASLPLTRGLGWRGVMLVSAEFTDHQPFTPVVALPLTATRQLELTKPEFKAPGWFPARPFALNRFGAQLAVVPGQFNNQEEGIERLYSEMEFWAYYSDSGDYAPPEIDRVTTEMMGGGWEFNVWVSDPSGVYDVVVTYADSPWQSLHLTQGVDFNNWHGYLDGVGKDVLAFVQAVDKAGNVTMVGYFDLVREVVVGGVTEWAVRQAASSPVAGVRMPFLPLVLRDY